jgi:hypothetical protein
MAEPITEEVLIGMLDQEITQATGWDGDELSALRTKALGYYYGELPKPEGTGVSKVVSTDVGDMIEAVVASMMPALASDSIVEFSAENEQGVDQAQQESDIVNFVIMDQNRGFVMIQEAIRDALLLRNGWIKVWLDDAETIQVQRFPGVPAEVVAAVEGMAGKTDKDVDVVSEPNRENSDLFDVEVRVTSIRQRVRVVSVDPTTMYWQSEWDEQFVEGIRFLAERRFEPRTDLIQQGFSKTKVNRAPAGQNLTASNTDTIARFRRPGGGGGISPGAVDITDHSMQELEIFECFYRVDMDGDGIAEQRRIIIAGGSEILANDIVDFVPYATGTPFLQPHQLNGLGVYDRLRNVQDIKTKALRNWLDNQAAVNKSRIAADEKAVNLNDATDNRSGGVVRTKGSPHQSIMAFPVVDIGPSTLALLTYADKMRSEGSGASLDLQSAALQVAGDTAHGVERQMGSREQLAAMMARTLAETMLRSAWLLTHRALRSWITADMEVQSGGRFITANPAQWVERESVNLKTGLSVGERAQRKGALAEVLQQQIQILGNGLNGQLTDLPSVYSALIDWTRAAMLDNGERYYVDPKSDPAKQAKQQADQQAQQQQQFSMQTTQAIALGAQQVEQIKAAMDKYEADQDTRFDYFKAILDAAIEEMKLGIPNEVDALQVVGGAAADGAGQQQQPGQAQQ